MRLLAEQQRLSRQVIALEPQQYRAILQSCLDQWSVFNDMVSEFVTRRSVARSV